MADGNNHNIRKIAPNTGSLSAMDNTTAVVTTLAGSGAGGAADATGTAATFNYPQDITTDGSALYVADSGNNKIRMIAPASGSLSAMDSTNAVVSSLTGAANSSVSAGAADGAGAAATFNWSSAITTDGARLYVADSSNNKIRMIAPASGALSAMTGATATVSSLTGPANTAGQTGFADGAGAAATFNYISGITTDGRSLYVMDSGNNMVRKIK